MQLRVFSKRFGTDRLSLSLFFLFVRCASIVSKNAVHVCLRREQVLHFLARLSEFRKELFLLLREPRILILKASDGRELLKAKLVKRFLCRLVQRDFRFVLRKKTLGVSGLAISRLFQSVLKKRAAA